MRVWVGLLMLLSAGCAKPYLKVNPVVDPQNPMPALLVNSSVYVVPRSSNQESIVQSVADASVQIAMNGMLDEFGRQVKETTGPLLAEQGFSVQIDPQRAKEVRKRDWTGTMNSLTVLTGAWSDPDGVLFALSPNTLFRRKAQAKVGEALGRGQPEAFVFSTVTIERRVSWLFLRHPRVQLQLLVIDPQGQDLLLARAKGDGKKQLLVCDRDPENLRIGLEGALAEMAALEPEVLIPKEPKSKD